MNEPDCELPLFSLLKEPPVKFQSMHLVLICLPDHYAQVCVILTYLYVLFQSMSLILNCLSVQPLSRRPIQSLSPETTNAFYYGLSVCPVTVTGPDHEQLVNPASITELSAHSVVTRETINAIIVFPASVLEDMFCLSLVSQSLLRLLCRGGILLRPGGRLRRTGGFLLCLLRRRGLLPCLLRTGGLLLCLLRRGGQLSGSGGLLPRRGGLLSCSGGLQLRPFCRLHHGPPVLPVLPQSQGLTPLHGPGAPSLPLFHLRSTTLLDWCVCLERLEAVIMPAIPCVFSVGLLYCLAFITLQVLAALQSLP